MREFLAASVLAVIFLFPVPAKAIDGFDGGAASPFVSFGGMVSLITPCVGPYGGSYVVDVEGIAGGRFVWTPFTLTYMFGPPSHPGQYLLGLAGIPTTCPTAYGRRGALINWLTGPGMLLVGTSL